MRRLRLTMAAAALGLLAGLLLAACGGGGGGASDESYVRGVCDAFHKFQEDGTRVFNDPEVLEDEEELAKRFGELVRALADDLDDVRAPSDVEQYHDRIVERFHEIADQFESGSVDDLSDLGDVPEPPQDVQDRLAAAAADVEECEGLDIF